ncbi:unnamed protein product, partial [Pylaiella littoralis]
KCFIESILASREAASAFSSFFLRSSGDAAVLFAINTSMGDSPVPIAPLSSSARAGKTGKSVVGTGRRSGTGEKNDTMDF